MALTELDIREEREGNRKVAVLTGVSGSGKDYLISQLLKADPQIGQRLSIVNFGEALFQRVKGILEVGSRDDLGTKLTQEQIMALIPQVLAEVKEPAIINTHVVYEQRGSLQINPQFHQYPLVDTYVFVWSSPELITQWRKQEERRRAIQTPEEIMLSQEIGFEVTRILARYYGRRFLSICNRPDNLGQNVAHLLEAITEMINPLC